MPKISALPAISAIAKEDELAIVDDSAGSTKKITIEQLLGLIYPVGSYYFNETDSTNPGTLFGFGTWVAASAGRVPVGKNTSGTFVTAGSTGGAETHTLITSEMPSHDHNAVTRAGASGLGSNELARANATGSVDNIALMNASGGGGAHNNLQPYIVVYIWKRTA